MKDCHLVLLPNPYSPPSRLLHERSRPPGAREDNILEVLEVKTCPTRLELDEENLVLAVNQMQLGLCQHLSPLLRRQLAAVEPRPPNRITVREEVAQQLHLLVEVAEDDPLLRNRIMLDKTADALKLRAGVNPVGATVEGAQLVPPALNINLRVEADLAETHDETETAKSISTAICELRLPPANHLALDSTVELCLIIRLKVQRVGLLNGRLRKVRHRRPQLFHRPRHDVVPTCLLRIGGTEQLKEGVEVGLLVDDGRGSEKPPLLTGNTINEVPADSLVGQAVRLITDDAVPRPPLKEVGLLAAALIIDEEEVGRVELQASRRGPATILRWHPAIQSRAGRRCAPLLNDGQRAKKEGVLKAATHCRRRLDEPDHLDGLAEAHFITEESSLMNWVAFARQHPLDTSNLVEFVSKSIPERGKGHAC